MQFVLENQTQELEETLIFFLVLSQILLQALHQIMPGGPMTYVIKRQLALK
jgi:hypothetical protein